MSYLRESFVAIAILGLEGCGQVERASEKAVTEVKEDAAKIGTGAEKAAPRVEHAVVGTLKKADATAKTPIIETAHGTEEVVRWTGHTTLRGLESGADAASLVGKEGSQVLVRWIPEGAEKTATAVEHLGKGAAKTVEGTVVRVDHAAKVAVVKTADGVEHTFHLAKTLALKLQRVLFTSLSSL